MNGITLNPGVLYFGQPVEYHTPVRETELIEFVENKDVVEAQNIIRIGNALSEFSFTVEVTRQAMDKFLMAVTGVSKYVLDIIREEGYENVYHLALHAKKHRTRKKNFNRARRILEKED